jgi:hypothetical protein
LNPAAILVEPKHKKKLPANWGHLPASFFFIPARQKEINFFLQKEASLGQKNIKKAQYSYSNNSSPKSFVYFFLFR